MIIDPDVSTTSMKYGFDTAGHALGSGERQLAGSAARAGDGDQSEAIVRTDPATAAGVGTDRKRKRAMSALPEGMPGAFAVAEGGRLRGACRVGGEARVGSRRGAPHRLPPRNERVDATLAVSRAHFAPQEARQEDARTVGIGDGGGGAAPANRLTAWDRRRSSSGSRCRRI